MSGVSPGLSALRGFVLPPRGPGIAASVAAMPAAMPAGIPSSGRPRADGDWLRERNLSGAGAYEADSLQSQELGGWLPILRSPDTEINLYRDRRVARTRDLVRNDGWATGAVLRTTDNTIGSLFRLMSQPDFYALARQARGFDATWAAEFAAVVDSEWRLWCEDPAHICEATRKMSMVQVFRLALRHKLLDGESVAAMLWRPELLEQGSGFATCVQLIDPDRLSNPFEAPDSHAMRGGVEIDGYGAPLAYHFRRAHQNDNFDSQASMVWDRVPRQTPHGRQIVLHDHDVERVGQARGIGILTPVLAKLKMLARYDGAELQQAVLQSVIGTFIESPYDPEQMRMAMSGDADSQTELSAYQQLRTDRYAGNPLKIGESRIPALVPGEKINFAPPRHPTSNFGEFEHAVLRNVAAATGTTAEAISADYSRANYSSLRAAMLDSWRTMIRRRSDFATGTATPVYACWLEEFIARNPALLPASAPEFMAARAAYSRCRWIGPGRGWVDPVKERQGAVLGLDAGFGTLRDECAEIGGSDWRETLDQRQIEVQAFKTRGLKLPEWGGNAETAAQEETKPQPV